MSSYGGLMQAERVALVADLGRVVDVEAEHVVLAEERVGQRLEDKHLGVGVWWIFVALRVARERGFDALHGR